MLIAFVHCAPVRFLGNCFNCSFLRSEAFTGTGTPLSGTRPEFSGWAIVQSVEKERGAYMLGIGRYTFFSEVDTVRSGFRFGQVR